MCGRFVGYRDLEALRADFPIDRVEADPSPNDNMASSQMIPVIFREDGENALRTFRWGLVPSWAKDPAIGSRMINARCETIDAKPSFRNAFRKQRCLIPVDGFYDWKGACGHKQPVYITLADGEPCGFVGLWEVSAVMRDTHHRMPAILKPEVFEKWIVENTTEIELKAILQSHIQKAFASRPVSNAVNAVLNNTAGLIKATKPK